MENTYLFLHPPSELETYLNTDKSGSLTDIPYAYNIFLQSKTVWVSKGTNAHSARPCYSTIICARALVLIPLCNYICCWQNLMFLKN